VVQKQQEKEYPIQQKTKQTQDCVTAQQSIPY